MENDPFIGFLYQQQLSGPTTQLSEKTLGKTFDILKILFANKINREALETQCFQGIPSECNGLRSLCWKILLDYLPLFPNQWRGSLITSRKNYESHINTHVIPRLNAMNSTNLKEKKPLVRAARSQSEIAKPVFEESKKLEDTHINGQENIKDEIENSTLDTETKRQNSEGPCTWAGFGMDDHPLSTAKDSKWNGFFKDQKLMEDIMKDTKRTRSTTEFFQTFTDYPLQKVYGGKLLEEDDYEKETQIDVLSRILFIYAKLNPNVGYMQGMNEVLAPIYYCFYKDRNPMFMGRAEADAFNCFSKLMKEIQDSFVKRLDDTDEGIQTRVKVLNEMIKKIDKQLWAHLDKHKVNPQFYSLKWLMLLLAQEFSVDNVLEVWDRLWSHPKKMDYLYYLCLAIIECERDALVEADDFASIMAVLQRNVGEDLDKIFSTGFRLYKQYAKPEELVQHIILPQ